ncbi:MULTISPECIES: carbohydrate ABC transporter permease [unclassified Streptomyces]|uniref:carbohydrate ABC transporter permease n=1 Tax=unclassified Streptomyces TaxID=2593676 RepID=UPI0037F3C229
MAGTTTRPRPAVTLPQTDKPRRTTRPRRGGAERPAWSERPSLPAAIAKGLVLAVICLVVLYPMVYILAVSLSDQNDVAGNGLLLWPKHWSLESYRTILAGGLVTRALIVSILVTAVGTVVSMALTVLTAYSLSRTRDVPGSRFVLWLVLGTMFFSAGIIPNYLLVKQLGMLDSYWSLIIPNAVNAFNLVVVRNAFMDLPAELFDSARIDGASEWQILWRIVLPLSKAVIAVVSLFYAVALWSDFFSAMIYLNDTAKWPIQLVLRQFVLQGESMTQLASNPNQPLPQPQTLQMAITVVATLPILIVYPFVQRFFTKGILVGAVKG